MHTVFLGLGANMGNRKRTIRQAINRIEELIGTIERRSALYETKPWGFRSSTLFINACVRCSTELTPRQVLTVTQKIEQELGRTAKSQSGVYQDRMIDIDILLYDDLVLNEPDLKIPHPLIQERDFVMIPLKECYN